MKFIIQVSFYFHETTICLSCNRMRRLENRTSQVNKKPYGSRYS